MTHQMVRARVTNVFCKVIAVAGAIAVISGLSFSIHGQAKTSEADAYVGAAFALMQEHYAFQRSVNWSAVRERLFRAAAGAETPTDTYEAIRGALSELNDHHSRLILTDEQAQAEKTRRSEKHLPPPSEGRRSLSPFRDRVAIESRMTTHQGKKYALISVPMHVGPDLTGDFATTIQNDLLSLQARHPLGWIVDLRGNRGGNMWPMLAGIGPLLGADRVGGFLDQAGHLEGSWHYADGHSFLTRVDSKVGSAESPGGPHVDIPATPPVAVLIDGATGSSGEAVAIAFCGRSRTRFFGITSGGSASSPRVWPLSDGATIMLAESAMTDRNGRTYELGVVPQEVVTYRAGDRGEDTQVLAAMNWLAGQPR